MHCQKFYESERDSMYNVHFPNKLGYSIDVIKEIFSEFGNVASVTKAGDDFGFRFVKYRTKEEVLRCIEGLKNHKTIRLLPKRPKPNDDQQNGQSTNNGINKREFRESKGNRAPREQRKPEDGEKFRHNNGRRTEGNWEYTNRLSDDTVPTERSVQTRNEKSQQTSMNVVSLNEDKKENGLVPREDHQEQVKNRQEVGVMDADNVKPIDLLIQPQVPAEANKVCNSAVPLTVPQFATTVTLRTPLLQAVTEEGSSNLADAIAGNESNPLIPTTMPTTPTFSPVIIGEDLPNLVPNSSKLEKPSETMNSQRTMEAEAIVVANVHIDYGVHYILHLFEKHGPICVSPMKIIAKQGLRYCVVYVQSPVQACDIERKFDNYSLCGKELIVLRALNLTNYL